MTQFTLHTQDTAPDAAKPMLDGIKGKFGMVPNILAAFAEAPNVLKGYLDLAGATANGTLSPLEQQIVQITASRLNGCHYCIAAHSTIADGQKLDRATIDALRDDTVLADRKHEALRQFAITVVTKQGWVDQIALDGFLAAGYSKGQALEVILSVALKTITNYANHLIDTPVDAAFQARAVDPASLRKAS